METMFGAIQTVHLDRALDSMTRSIEKSRDFEEAIRATVNAIGVAMKSEVAVFWVYEKFNDGRIYAKAKHGKKEIADTSFLPGEGVVGGIIENATVKLIEDYKKANRYSTKDVDGLGLDVSTMLCLPLKGWEVTFGTIQLINKTDGTFFTNTDVEVATTLTETASHLIQSNKFLEHFRQSEDKKYLRAEDITFSEIFDASSKQEMEERFRRVPRFGLLRLNEQETALNAARTLYEVLQPKDKKRGFKDLFKR